MRKLFDRKRLGIAITILGCLIYGTWRLWVALAFRSPPPRPFSMEAGSNTTTAFTLQKSDHYVIAIRAKRRLPSATLYCLMGISFGPVADERCTEKSVIHIKWVLMSKGQFVAQGSSDDDPPGRGGGGKDSVERDIGVFRGVAGKTYSLQLTSAANAEILATSDPQLVVELIGSANEDAIVEDFYLSVIFLILEVIGVTLWISAAVGERRRRAAQ